MTKKYKQDEPEKIVDGLVGTDTIQGESSTVQADPRDTKIAELTDTLQRLQADFENYKKRDEKDKGNFAKYANQKLLESLLPLLDSFELAIKNGNSADYEKFKKGIEMIYAQFHSILNINGVKKINALGKKFDPYLHEVLMQSETEDDSKDEVVLEEFQKGFMLNGSVLRHTKVKIGKKKCEDKNNAENQTEKTG